MATVQDLKRRIRSVTNTRKITRAMELVAAAQLRRAQTRIEAMRPYAETMRELIAGVGARERRPSAGCRCSQQRETVETVAIVPLTGDRGLAGAVQRADPPPRVRARARSCAAEGKSVRWLAVGKKGALDAPLPRATSSTGAYVGFTDRPAYADAQAIAHRVAELYIEGEVDRVVARLQHLRLARSSQTVTEQDVLPISADILETDEEERARRRAARRLHLRARAGGDPRAAAARSTSRPQLYRALLESAASEQGARMTAMRNASKNAGELIDTLTLQMNRARQAEITQEILEVVARRRSAWS